MKINQSTAISTSTALLVPYEAHHVQKYHSWMQDPDIQEATASEPMTIEEEYENQQSWRTSNDKLTFIVCAPLNSESQTAKAKDADSNENMRGDINFFLYPYSSDDDEGEDGWYTGEVDVMIASTSHRGQGLGRAAVCALLVYIRQHIVEILEEYSPGKKAELQELMVKIKENNAGSRKLFSGLGFVLKGEVNYFGEVVMTIPWEEVAKREWWESAERDYKEARYEGGGEGEA
ncbi:Fc.00g047640.m01.CDS01 [Cosmosporella sp. VM-42]